MKDERDAATVGESQANEEYAKMREALWLAIAQRDAARQSRARLVLALRKYRKTERVWEMFSLMEIVKERNAAIEDARVLVNAWKNLRENPNDTNHLTMLNLSITLRAKYAEETK